jgi:NAD(P)H dehydrogenase (quinone)
MKVLLVFAHPEQRSLNAALRDVAVAELRELGHEVEISDLYALGWKASVDREDFPALSDNARLKVAAASQTHYKAGQLTSDVQAEQQKLLRADGLILQFPLWWFSMPAILKGWVDRVFSYGFGYGIGEHSDRKWGDRYGEGTFAGKRAMLIVTAGGWAPHYSPRGINGPIDDLLFPIQHGILHYAGFDVLPPYVAYSADRLKENEFDAVAAPLRGRMREFFTAAPLAYRRQNGGDYSIPQCELHEGLERPGVSGFALHIDERS